MPHPRRVRFAGDIIAEFLPPRRRSLRSAMSGRPDTSFSNKVIILAPGMPGVPKASKAMYSIAKRGYWVFLPRYRGTWESDGTFLDHSPHEDILDVVDGISESFTSIWTEETFTIPDPEVYVIGSSFGGPAAILCSMDERVKKAVAIAPLIDWKTQKDSPTESMDWLGEKIQNAFGNAYRFSVEDWERLSQGKLYNPIDHIDHVDPKRLLILHAKDDDVVLYEPSEAFAKEVGCQFVSVKKGGHLGSRTLKTWRAGRKIWKFLEE